MNKTELINAVAEKSELSKKDATSAVDAVFDVITGSLQNSEKVQLIGFGNFEVRERAARTHKQGNSSKQCASFQAW